jgi:hypothetical protein
MDLSEESAHVGGVHLPGDHPVQLAFQGTDRTVHIQEFTLAPANSSRIAKNAR